MKVPTAAVRFMHRNGIRGPKRLLCRQLPKFRLSRINIHVTRTATRCVTIDPRLGAISTVCSSPLRHAHRATNRVLTTLGRIHRAHNRAPLRLAASRHVVRTHGRFHNGHVNCNRNTL